MEMTPPDQDRTPDDKSDVRVVMQFFIVPLSLVVVLVLVFFGLQFARSRQPDAQTTLRSLERYEGFLGEFVGELKRWQYGYDLSLLMRSGVERPEPDIIPELSDAFRKAGRDGDLKLRRYLALALGHAAHPAAVAALAEGAEDGDPQTRLFSIWGLMRSGDRRALPALRAATADPDAGVRKMAVFALGERADADSAPLLRAALGDSEIDVVWNAALSLARLGDEAAVPVLLEMLRVGAGDAAEHGPAADTFQAAGVDRGELALNAIRAVALLRTPEAEEPLQRLIEAGADPEIERSARIALQLLRERHAGGTPP